MDSLSAEGNKRNSVQISVEIRTTINSVKNLGKLRKNCTILL